jgi:hypothetical protein
MILTPLNIQVAIIKAFYALAKKSVKYYTGLALGKNNTCLFKEMRLLRAYVEILKNFEIVGNTIACNCCIEGDYTVLLNTLSEATNSDIQFGCDNQGYLYFNNTTYVFDYIYDPSNSTLKISFAGVGNTPVIMNLINTEFTSVCNITNSSDGSVTPNSLSPLEVATNEVTEIPVTVDNAYGDWSGSINIYVDNITTTPLISLTIPVDIINNPDAIVELWNSEYPNWILYHSENTFIMSSPLDNVNYSGYVFEFNQYQGGSNPGPTGPAAFTTTDLFLNGVDTQGKLLLRDAGGTVYQDSEFVNYLNVQEIVDVLKINCEPYSFELLESKIYPEGVFEIIPRILITLPENSFAYFNSETIEIEYTYELNTIYSEWQTQGTFVPPGVDPTLTDYRSVFETGVVGTFINTDLCTPTPAEQTCLSNSQVSKIIAHINKLAK